MGEESAHAVGWLSPAHSPLSRRPTVFILAPRMLTSARRSLRDGRLSLGQAGRVDV